MARHMHEGQDVEQDPVDKNSADTKQSSGKSGKRHKNLVSNLLILVGVALLLVAGAMYLRNMWNYHTIDEKNDRIAEYAKLTDDAEQPPVIDWAALKEINPDIVGWLEVPGTVVNYPVYQTGDNDYYLHHAPDGSSSLGGAVFLDFENTTPGMVDPQTIVYGHHMRNGSQFKVIADMDKQEMFDGVKLLWYVTEQNNYDLVPLFVYYTNEGDLDVRQFKFDNLEAFRTYLRGYYAEAQTKRPDADAILAQVEHVFTLSTCNYYDGYGRTLLVCVPRSEVPGTPQYEARQAQLAQQKAEADAAAAAAAAANPPAEAAPEGEAAEEEVVVEEGEER